VVEGLPALGPRSSPEPAASHQPPTPAVAPLSQYKSADMNGATGKCFITSVLNTDAGQSAFVRSCSLIGDLQPLYKHEGISDIVAQIWDIANDCPELLPPDDPTMTELPTVEEKNEWAKRALDNPEMREQLVAIFYDDGWVALARACPREELDRPRAARLQVPPAQLRDAPRGRPSVEGPAGRQRGGRLLPPTPPAHHFSRSHALQGARVRQPGHCEATPCLCATKRSRAFADCTSPPPTAPPPGGLAGPYEDRQVLPR